MNICKSAAVGMLLIMSLTGLIGSANADSKLPADVPTSHYAAPAVKDLVAKGIIKPSDGSKFHGDQYLTRYEAAIYLDRMVHYMEAAHAPLYATSIPAKQMPKLAAGPGHNEMIDLVKNRFLRAGSVLVTAPSSALVTPTEMAQQTIAVVMRLEDRRNQKPDPDMNE